MSFCLKIAVCAHAVCSTVSPHVWDCLEGTRERLYFSRTSPRCTSGLFFISGNLFPSAVHSISQKCAVYSLGVGVFTKQLCLAQQLVSRSQLSVLSTHAHPSAHSHSQLETKTLSPCTVCVCVLSYIMCTRNYGCSHCADALLYSLVIYIHTQFCAHVQRLAIHNFTLAI